MAIKDVLLNFDNVTKTMAKEAEKALYYIGADLKKEAVELTPKASGQLRQSVKVTMIKKGNSPTVEVSFGDSRVKYAAAVHEINKNYIEPGTGWKYLERPLKKNEKKYLNYLRKKIGGKL